MYSIIAKAIKYIIPTVEPNANLTHKYILAIGINDKIDPWLYIFICNVLINKPNIVTRGFIQVNENEELIKMIEFKTSILTTEKLKEPISYTDLKSYIQTNINSYIIELTGRKPIILPIILDIKRN